MTWLVVLRVKSTLRAVTRTAAFRVPNLVITPSILLISTGLRVDATLLSSSSLGLATSVCVTVMCRRRLLESRLGQVSVPLCTLTCLSSLTVWALV